MFIPTDTKNLVRLLIVVLSIGAAPGINADMLISPTRAILNDDLRSAELTLRNTSDGARTYRLGWQDKKVVDARGAYEPVEENEAFPSASGMVRFSPRQIIVGPGENQTVRLSYRPSADIEPGEYRSFLHLQVVSEESEPTSVMSMEDAGGEGVNFKLFMQMSFSIPVVVRHETSPPNVKITDVKVLPGEGESRRMALEVRIARQGESSSFGQVIVEAQETPQSPVVLIGKRDELSIFPEMKERIVRVPLNAGGVPAGSWIRVAYEGAAEYTGTLWDERIFQSK